MTELDLARYVRPGDRVVWGQGPGEPQTLTELLVAQRHRLGGVTCFVGLPGSDVIRPEHADALTFETYCGTGRNQRLPRLAVIPAHYAALPGLLAGGRLAAEMRAVAPSATVTAVARRVAELVPDGATVQFGVGGVPEACLDALAGHRELGLHSGLLSDAAMRLIETGVATGARKSLDRGVAVGGFLGGTAALFRFAHRNPQVRLRETGYTHDPLVLAGQHRFTAINSALEVDLSGQVNAEELRGRYVGAAGGASDFLRGAARSPGGLPIIALPSTAGAASRIVARLNGPVSTPRSDAGLIVTEYGVADLRGAPVSVRYERMLAVAHPEHRAALAAELEEHLMNGALR